MALITLPGGGSHTASVPITVTPAGQACSVTVILTSDAAGANVVATSSSVAFASTGSAQAETLAITTPTATGTYYAFVEVTVGGHGYVVADPNQVAIPGVGVGTITWT
jgi:hypothetical protein